MTRKSKDGGASVARLGTRLRARAAVEAEADDLLLEYDALTPAQHARALREGAGVFDLGEEVALEIADEMDRRDRAKVRFWFGSKAAEEADRKARMVDPVRTTEHAQAAPVDDAFDYELEEDSEPRVPARFSETPDE